MNNATEEMHMSTSEQAELDASWKRAAREGEIIQATRIYRAFFGTGLVEAKEAVLKYRKELPEDQRLEAIELSEVQAIAEFEKIWAPNTPWTPLCATFDETTQRRLRKALAVLNNQVRHRTNRQAVKTGPMPPRPQWAGHHWLKVYDCDGHYHGTQVMFWQPGVQAWCHSGMYAAYAEVDTEHWLYHAECPMPE